MDELWGPPSYYQDEDTDSFNFCYDVIEDTAINEKSCKQVLNILISKQDTDISELEDELMELLIQLACTDEEFSDMVSMSLKVNVNFLDLSVRKLKDGAGDFSSTSRQPAESINDIMKSLFGSYLRNKAQQFADKTVNVSSSYQVRAVNSSEKKKQISSSSIANQLEKRKRVLTNTIPLTRVKTEEESSIYPSMSHMFKYSAQGPFRAYLEKTDKYQKKPPMITTQDILQKNTPNCKSICQKPSLETQGNLKMVKPQPYDETSSPTPLSICLVESSQEPLAIQNQNSSRDLDLFDEEPNPKIYHHQQQPKVSLSVRKTYKRRQILDAQLMKSSSLSPLLLKGPEKKYEVNYYTVPELRAIAKERKLTGYSKLRKMELGQFLGIELIEGRKPKKEAEKKGEKASSKDRVWTIAIAG